MRFASYELVHQGVHDEGNEYSFELVFNKIGSLPGIVEIPPIPDRKKAVVVRYGGIGDIVMATPIFRMLRESGYEVTFNTNKTGWEICRHDPHIDHFIVQQPDAIPNKHLEFYWKTKFSEYDKCVNLSATVEQELLFVPTEKDYTLPAEERRKRSGSVNSSSAWSIPARPSPSRGR